MSKEKRKEYMKKWRENNPDYFKSDKIKTYTQKWFKEHPGYQAKWSKQNKEKNPLIKLQDNIRIYIHRNLNKIGSTKCQSTLKTVGLESWDKFREHIQNQFTEGMNWKNYGQGKNNTTWHIDHIIPISSAKTEEEVNKLNHYTNLRPMWGSDNQAKGNKIK
jgi:hypothetical protein